MKKLIFLITLFIILFISVSLVKAYSAKRIIDKNKDILEEKAENQTIKGYIIKLKEKPVLEKKIEIEKYISDMEKKGGIYTKYAETSRTQLSTKIKEQKNIISNEHQAFLKKGSGVVSNLEKKILKEYKDVFNGIVLYISKSEAEELKKLSEVEEIYPNLQVNATLMESVPLINADDVWKLKISGMNVTGKSIKIAIIDTGIDYTHPDLGGCFGPSCRVIGGYDFVNDDNDPIDDHGHGTHCAGIAAGNGTLKGVAPDAKLMAFKVLDSSGSGSFSNVIAGIEKAVDPNGDGDYSDHADVISMSLGADCFGNYDLWCGPDDPLSQAVDTAVQNGVVVVVAAGNSGPNYGTIGSPGTAKKAITVGATYKKDYTGKYWNDQDPRVDQITSFSSRGPTSAGIKPDIVAPGAIICAARYDEIFPEDNHPYYYPCFDNKHVQLAGTSMATPHVAGIAALIKQAHPDWNPDEIKSALEITAVNLNYDANTQGYGRVDALSSVQLSSKPPVALIDTHGKLHGKEIRVNGTATVGNFVSYTLYYKNVDNEDWNEICSSNTPKINDILCIWDIGLLNDGKYTLKLETRSQTYTNEDIVFVTIENTEITFPGDLRKIYVFGEAQPFQEIIPAWKKIFINGTAAGGNFINYNIEWCSEKKCSDEGVFLTYNGLKPVVEGTLCLWDTSILNESGFYYINLTTFYVDRIQKDDVKIYIDVTIHSGWPKSLDEINTYSFLINSHDQPTIADINNDVKKELIFAVGRNITIFKHDGEVLTGWPREITTEYYPGYSCFFNGGPAVDDLDKDGYDEVVIGDTCGYLHIFKHDGSYLTGWPKKISSILYTPTLADIDRDTYPDIIIGDQDGFLHIIDRNGNNLPGWPKLLPLTITDHPSINVHPAAVADINEDGYLEIVVVNMGNNFTHQAIGFWVLNNDGTVVTGWPIEYYNDLYGWDYRSNPVLGDVDGDGKIEIVSASYNGRVHVWKPNGLELIGWPIETNCEPIEGLIVGDVDKDKKLEILVYCNHSLSMYDDDGSLVNGFTKTSIEVGSPTLGNLINNSEVDIATPNSELPYENEPYRPITKVYDWWPLVKFNAYDSQGHILESFPKFVENRVISPVVPITDLDDDGNVELIAYTFDYVYVWDSPGKATIEGWPEFYHDERHTSLYLKCYSNSTSTDGICHEECGASPKCDKISPGTGCCAICYNVDITGKTYGVPDGKVNAIDVALAARAFGTKPGYPRWDPLTDINHDNKTDAKDVVLVAKKFGAKCESTTTVPMSGTASSMTSQYVHLGLSYANVVIILIALIAIVVIVFVVFKFFAKKF
jgi:subtilisin family serine protease